MINDLDLDSVFLHDFRSSLKKQKNLLVRKI